MNWKDDILRGVSTVPKVGGPGRIIVTGETAEPVLTGPTNARDVIIAAAQYGQGRIVVFSHGGYGTRLLDNKATADETLTQLHTNIKQWITNGRFAGNQKEILNLNSDKLSANDLQGAKIVISSGAKRETIPLEAVQEFIKRGGGFIHATTPWGWLQTNPGKTIENDLPYYKILTSVGLYYTTDIVRDTIQEFHVATSKAHEAHLLRFLQAHATNPSEIAKEAEFMNSLKLLPKNAFNSPVLSASVETIWATCRANVQKCVPSKKHPTKNEEERGLLDMWQLCVELKDISNVKAPGCEHFPGDFSSPPPKRECTLELSSERLDAFSTGSYAQAGQAFTIEVVSGNEDHAWTVLVGGHLDFLKGNNVRRWPDIQVKTKLSKASNQISSPFGGLIYLQSPDKPSRITVKLIDVVEAPQFKLEDGANGVSEWNKRREAPGLWADIIGKYIIITVPSTSVRHLDDPSEALQVWDRLITIYHELRGTDINKHRRQWIVTDEQPSHGYMHTGYPIVTGLDVADPKFHGFLLNGNNIKTKGNWGTFHEIGHNMQRPEWTFEGTVEVTCNIFSLHAMDKICGQKPWIHSFLQKQLAGATKYLKNGAKFHDWQQSAGVALFIYAQLIRDFGWDCYRRVFHAYEAMDAKQKPNKSQQKMDEWFKNFSQTAGYSLAPLVSFWGIPVSDAALQYMNQFPSYLPDDEVTQSVQERTNSIVQKCTGVIRKLPV